MKVQKHGPIIEVLVSGALNEETHLAPISAQPGEVIQVHLDQLSSMNSTGVKQWLLWLRESSGEQWEFWGCPPIFITSLNMIEGFLPPNSKIHSFYLPYFSEATGEEHLQLILRDQMQTDPPKLPAPLDRSGNPMRPDVIESRYLRFLSRY